MERFTKIEISWIVGALEHEAERYKEITKQPGHCIGIATLRAEQMRDLADRLQRTIEAENKRIEISY